jgi:hypothetical protein
MTDKFSDEHRRLYRWFFKEYNNQYINYEKYYRASQHYQRYAKIIHWGTGILSSIIITLVLAIVQGIFPEILTQVAIGASLATGVTSLVGSIGNFERKHIQYYNSGQEHDDLYSKFDRVIKVEFPNPDADIGQLKKECEELIDEKDELNGLTPQLESRWYERLKKERGHDSIHWTPQPLEKMREGEFGDG